MRVYQIINQHKTREVITDIPAQRHGIVAQEYLNDDEPEFDIEREADRYAFQRWYEDGLELERFEW